MKVAHWNLKGPQFASLHPLFETIAVELAGDNDDVAERAVALGAHALGTVRYVARALRISEYPLDVARDLEHARLLAKRIEKYLDGVREAREAAEKLGDADTVDLLTVVARWLREARVVLAGVAGVTVMTAAEYEPPPHERGRGRPRRGGRPRLLAFRRATAPRAALRVARGTARSSRGSPAATSPGSVPREAP